MPTTEAGRALALAGVPMGETREWFADDIERVEAEARAEGYAAGLAAARPVIDAARAILPESLNADLPSGITSDDPMVGIRRLQAIGDRWQALRDALAVDPSGHVGPADLHDPRSEEQG